MVVGRGFAAHWVARVGVQALGAGLSAGERQRPAIPAEMDRLWGPTHRGVRFGIHRVAPDALLLCHWWVGNAREMWGFGAFCWSSCDVGRRGGGRIGSFRLRLHSGLRQSGSALRRGDFAARLKSGPSVLDSRGRWGGVEESGSRGARMPTHRTRQRRDEWGT